MADARPTPSRDIGSDHRRVPCSDLVDRETELETLTRCFDSACDGAGTAVMICGPAGMGKTSLVQAFVASLDERDDVPTVLRCGCDDLIRPRPFGPFRDMIRSSGLLSDDLAVDPNSEDILVNLTDILDRPNRPAVLVVEDAQWADDASIDVMRYLARRVVSLHAMLIITTRDDDAGGSHHVRNLLTGSSSSAPVHIALGPLSLEAVDQLAADSPLEGRYLHEVTGGNPLLVRQLLSADAEDATRLARETLMSRAAALSPEGRGVLQTLSVIPEGAAPTLVRTLFSDQPSALHEAEGTGLLLSTKSHIRFRHELGRLAVVEAMSFGERMAATDRALDALTETGEDPTVLVHIARAAGDGPLATRFALDVFEQGLAAEDHRGAWTLARIALECTVELSTERTAWLHTTAAVAGRAINRHIEATHHGERALQLLIRSSADADVDSATDTDADIGTAVADRLAADRALASAWLVMADLQGDAGDHLRARTALRTARELLADDTESIEWVRCNTRLAAAAMLRGEPDRAADMANKSVEAADINGWTAELVHALEIRGLAAGGPATPDGLEDLDRARELGAMHGPAGQHVSVLLSLADGYLRCAKTGDAEQVAEEAVRCSREQGLERLRHRSQVQLARILVHRGRTTEAEQLATTLTAEMSDPGVVDAGAEAVLARVAIRRGDDEAREMVERAWLAAVATGEIDKLAFAGASRLERSWVEGDDAALRQFARYLAGLGERHRHHRLRALAIRVLHRIEDTETTDGPQPPRAEPFPGCPAPFAAALSGEYDRAAELWEAAAEPFDQALELIESTEASAAFQGLRLLDRSGATRTADLVRHRMRMRGFQGVPRGPRKSSDGAVPILTGRQIDVLRLIAKGHTNAEIAEELFVARRTVDNHVSAILSRLGAKGRAEAAAEAVSRGLIDPI